jgi:hypothetical protein
MATVYKSAQITAGVQPRVLPEGIEIVRIATFLNSTAFVINDTVQLVNIEANPAVTNNGPLITGTTIDMPPMDSSTGFTWILGDSGTTNRFITTSTVGQSSAGGIVSLNADGGLGFGPFISAFGAFGTYTAVSLQTYTVVLKVTAAASGTPTTGNTITAKISYTYDPY